MKLTIKNIGKLKEAEVEINGITVITGENNTGKSTVGKVLFSLLSSFSELNNKIFKIRNSDIIEVFLKFLEKLNKGNIDLIFKLSDEIVKSNYTKSEIFELININKNFISEKNLEAISEEIFKFTKIQDIKYSETILSDLLSKEFDEQINTIGLNVSGEIILKIKLEEIKIQIDKNKVTKIENEKNLWNRVIYIDNPFVLDNLTNYALRDEKYLENHNENLETKLVNESKKINISKKILIEEKLKVIEKKLEEIIFGEIKNIQNKWVYSINDGNDLNIKNLSAGLKTFAIIKMLLQNGALEENGTIILDEPEIHLHPEWQLKFAELVVLLQKEFGMHILLTTHSPYFLKAIQVYSKKYEIENKCKYYLSENIEESSILIDKTENTEDIYYKMAIPFENLMNEEELL